MQCGLVVLQLCCTWKYERMSKSYAIRTGARYIAW
jgi:hypothetical protein